VTDERRKGRAPDEAPAVAEAGAPYFPGAPSDLVAASPILDADPATATTDTATTDDAATFTATPAPPAVPPHVASPVPAGPPIPLATTRGLLPAAFDLVIRSNEDMRQASFYIGAVLLATAGPLVLALWAVVVADLPFIDPTTLDGTESQIGGLVGMLAIIALIGSLVAAVESRTLATAVLGARMAGRPITRRHAVARARARFWQAVGASLVVGIVLTVAQGVVSSLVAPVMGQNSQASVITSTVVTATIGAPFAYVLCGIVLGDVGPLESIRRSFMVARARWGAAAIIVTFETVALLLIAFGLSAGTDLILRAFTFVGIGPDSGVAGLTMATVAIVAIVFALGTLLYTVTALTVAPQVVMFVGLTHATVGLDRVDDARTARLFTRPMLIGAFVAFLLLAGLVLTLV
jgi:hypothetical protein